MWILGDEKISRFVQQHKESNLLEMYRPFNTLSNASDRRGSTHFKHVEGNLFLLPFPVCIDV